MSNDKRPWWERFFNGDNQLRWSALRSHEYRWTVHVLPWIEFAQDTNVDLPIILPRLDANDEPSWYCAARSTRGALQLREALQAFIGPSYSDFDGRAHALNADDTVEAAFAECTIVPAYRIRACKPADVDRIQRALTLYLELLRRMPKPAKRGQQSFGALRTELDHALISGDEAEARRLLERIRSIGRLDAENLLFLELGVRAGLGQWRDIAHDGILMNRLVGLRLPPRVLADVHEALYRVYVEPSEDVKAPYHALEAFQAAGLARRSSLFGTRRGLRKARVVKSFFLYELAREDSSDELLTELASELEQLQDEFGQALTKLLPATKRQSTTDAMRAADEAFELLEMDRALEFYLQAPPSRKRVSRLILCAKHVGTSEAAKRVLDGLGSGDDIANLPTALSDRLHDLERMCATDQSSHPPKGWLDWARKVEAGLNEDRAMTALREQMTDWDSAALANHHDHAAELANIINNATGQAESLFREAAPLLFQAMMPESGTPPRQAKSLFEILITKVALLGDASQTELQLARELAGALLIMGLDENEYANLVSDLEDLLGAHISIFTLSWSLDLVELLAVHVCPDPERRLRLLLRVVNEARRLAHRLSSTDALVVQHLCQDYEIDCPKEILGEESADVARTGEILSGKKIGIYTLMESAGRRAAAILIRLCPTVRVELNGDHECTNRLINLARTADILVFAWKSSKHQAFYCIKDHRDGARPLLQPQGKGSSSILRAVLENV